MWSAGSLQGKGGRRGSPSRGLDDRAEVGQRDTQRCCSAGLEDRGRGRGPRNAVGLWKLERSRNLILNETNSSTRYNSCLLLVSCQSKAYVLDSHRNSASDFSHTISKNHHLSLFVFVPFFITPRKRLSFNMYLSVKRIPTCHLWRRPSI